jgi:hypothetical protein
MRTSIPSPTTNEPGRVVTLPSGEQVIWAGATWIDAPTTITIESGAMTITIPEPARQAVIDHALGMFAEARAFALACVDILVNEHGARRAGVDIEHFYSGAVGQQIGAMLDGKPVVTPREMVERALRNCWPWVVGLGEPGPERQAKIDAAWVEVTGGPAA